MDWNPVIQSVMAALIIGTPLALRKHIGSWFLRSKIKRMLRGANLGHGVTGLTTSVRNESQVELRVREVFLITPTAKLKFNPAGEESTNGALAELFSGPNATAPRSDSPFPRVPPLTNSTYLLPAGLVAHSDGPFVGISIKVEYDAYTGRRKVVEVHSSESANEMSRKSFDHFQGELRSGNLNKARQMWRLPPVHRG
jgi:hypothetical protein